MKEITEGELVDIGRKARSFFTRISETANHMDNIGQLKAADILTDLEMESEWLCERIDELCEVVRRGQP